MVCFALALTVLCAWCAVSEGKCMRCPQGDQWWSGEAGRTCCSGTREPGLAAALAAGRAHQPRASTAVHQHGRVACKRDVQSDLRSLKPHAEGGARVLQKVVAKISARYCECGHRQRTRRKRRRRLPAAGISVSMMYASTSGVSVTLLVRPKWLRNSIFSGRF